MANYKVHLVYYKLSGKYYASGDLRVPKNMNLGDIWERVASLREHGNLPGLRQTNGSYNDFIISVDVPGHPHEHPHLIIP